MEINLNNKTGIIRLGSEHCLILGHKPNNLTYDQINQVLEKERKVQIEQFGLFETATPNYTTYYPDVTPDELNPKEDEFINPIFRALSATIVWKGYRPIDFSKPGVLKASMSLLVGQTINADHETALGNAMGSVKSVSWQESYTVDGIKIPAGINAEYMIDGKSNPRISRGIMMRPPSIHSTSVSVRFEWEPSHKLKDISEFYNKLGTFDEKGNLYRLIVTKILQYNETSLVAHGADPYAQIIIDGKINNPKYAAGVYNFSAETPEGNKIKLSHIIDYKTDLSLSSDDSTIPTNINNIEKTEENQFNMEIIKILEEKFGLEAGSLTEENISEQIDLAIEKSKGTLNQSIEDLTAKLTDKETKVEELQAEVDKHKPLSEKFSEQVKTLREEAQKNYKLIKGDNVDENILSMLSTVEFSALTSLNKQYKEELDNKFPKTCKKCGSTDLNRSSSVNDDGQDGDDVNNGNTGGTKTMLSNKAAKERLKQLRKNNH